MRSVFAIWVASTTVAIAQDISPSAGFDAATGTSGYNSGDLFLAFFNSAGAPNDVLFDLGPLSAYQNAAPGVTYTITGFNNPSDVTGAVGTNGTLGQPEGGVGSFGSNVYWTVACSNFNTGELGVTAMPGVSLTNAESYSILCERLETVGAELAEGTGTGNSNYDAILSDTPVSNLLGINSDLNWSGGPLVTSASATGGTTSLVFWDLNKNHATSGAAIKLGTFTFDGSTLTFTAAGTAQQQQPGSGTIVNLSTRASIGTGANVLIAGFVLRGSGSKNVLLRGIGPTLGSAFGVPGSLSQPQLALTNTGTGAAVYTGTAWGGTPALSSTFMRVGAFALADTSADAAVVQALPAGSYTSQISGVGSTTGVALAEIYDADSGSSTASFVNISARAQVGTGANILIAGFVVGGNHTAQLLLRGVGPALSAYGISTPLAQPTISLFDSSSAVIVTNTGWGNALAQGTSVVPVTYRLATASDMSGAGAFSLPANSADSALVATVPPGSYTLQLAGTNGSTGIGLVEVYLLQ